MMTYDSVTIHPVRIPFYVSAPSGPVPRFVYSFILGIGRTITLVDTGVSGSEQMIFAKIRESGREPGAISMVILTHSHPDHIGGAKAILDAASCTFAAHSLEKAWIEDTDLQQRERPVPGFTSLVGGPIKVDRALGDGDTISLDEGRFLEVIHTPGHSPGSISLLLRPDMVLFSGDAIPVPGDLPVFDNPTDSLRSVERLMDIEDIRYLFSSWDNPREGEEVYWAMDDGYAWIEEVSGAIKEVRADYPEMDPQELTPFVIKKIGLPTEAANPMVTRTIVGTMRTQGHQR